MTCCKRPDLCLTGASLNGIVQFEFGNDQSPNEEDNSAHKSSHGGTPGRNNVTAGTDGYLSVAQAEVTYQITYNVDCSH